MKPSGNILYMIPILAVLVSSCTPQPKPIAYGSDACNFCSMTIVDMQHAAEMVTKKGKVYKFDAPECMLNSLKEVDTATVALLLVTDYYAPGKLIDATHATYLVSPEIPSPMGEFLTAFTSKEVAAEAKEAYSGELISWTGLRGQFK